MAKPKIRFQGYTEDWEQRKLGDIAKLKQGIQVDLERQYTEKAAGRERFIRIVDYTQSTDDIRYIDKTDNANYVDEKDIVVVRYGATAGFVGRGITGIIANNMFTINPLEELDKEFLYTYMKQEKMYNYLNLSNGSSAMPAINFGIMKSLDISYPSTEEQQQIGAYFSNLDHLITLHQRKCDETKKLKKFMLQKMFPQDGKKVPEIRFEGFTEDWEQRKLGDIAKLKQGIQVDLERQYTEKAAGRERFIRIVDYTQSTDDIRYIDKTDNANYVDEKDIVVVRYGATAGFVGRGITGIIANNMFTINPLEELDKEFLYTYMKQEKMYNYLNLSNGSSAMPAINFGIMKSLDISYPSTEEQQQIGAYFSNLDHLITLHQRKCDKLQEIKKYMLQNMFI